MNINFLTNPITGKIIKNSNYNLLKYVKKNFETNNKKTINKIVVKKIISKENITDEEYFKKSNNIN